MKSDTRITKMQTIGYIQRDMKRDMMDSLEDFTLDKYLGDLDTVVYHTTGIRI